MYLTEELKELIKKSIQKIGYDLIDVKFIKKKTTSILRIYINNKIGITVNDCANVSQKISEFLDTSNIFTIPYHLEISSPGIKNSTLLNKNYKKF